MIAPHAPTPLRTPASRWPSADALPGPHRRLGPWTLYAAAGPVPGLIARLRLPEPQRLCCLFAGLTLVAGEDGDPPHLRVIGAVAMRVTAQRVDDADAAMETADDLFELLTGVAGRPPASG